MSPKAQPPPWRDHTAYLLDRFGCRVHKISVDAGLSCPNRDGTIGTGGCIYCNAQGSGTGAAGRGLSVTEQLASAKAYIRKRFGAEKFIAYFQAFTNTFAPVERLDALWSEALAVPDVVGLSIGTRPDCAPEAVLDLAAGFARRSFFWMEYGLQSAHDRTLALIRRGHDAAAFADAVRRTRARGIPVCAHVILGLPGETTADMIATADFLAKLDVDGVKLHLLYVVRGSRMEELYRSGRYECLTEADYVDTASAFLSRLPPRTVIQRLTGDPHPAELVAPLWALKSRNRVLAAIRARMDELGLSQGSALHSPAP